MANSVPAPGDLDDVGLNDCHARVTDDGQLLIENALVSRRWAVGADGSLTLVGLFDKEIGREWIAPAAAPASPPTVPPTVEARAVTDHPVHRPSLQVTVTAGPARYTLTVFPSSPGVGLCRLTATTGHGDGPTAATMATPATVEATGVETTASAGAAAAVGDGIGLLESFTLRARHLRLTQVELIDQTDVHDNLVFERQWLLTDKESPIAVPGNLFFIEDCLTGDGLIVLRPIALPHARPIKLPFDLRVHGRQVTIAGGQACVTIPYSGGRTGRIVALHAYQRQWRPFEPARDARFLSNTWGDRSRDARINESFMMAEIEAGAQLGVDVIQIDDGWQRGRTANSAQQGGVWNGFWAADANFWAPHPDRLPNGLAPLVSAAGDRGMRFGLWFAPDSSDDFTNWQRDADALLALHREQGIDYFKIDGVKVHSVAGEGNLRRFYDAVLVDSRGRVSFDHDVTAEVRPSYFGVIDIGTIFVENRYTDWDSYWPHRTLRSLWQLAQHVDPVRLRMEFLNNARNVDRYGDDLLAPARYAPDYLFATVMFASPLGWFEASNLPPAYVEAVAPLVATWKAHRGAIFGGTIIPIGPVPDGAQVTGFVSKPRDAEAGGYLLLFRERCDVATIDVDLSKLSMRPVQPHRLAGEGTLQLEGNVVRVTLPSPLRYVLIKL